MADNAEGSSDAQLSFKVKTGGDSNKTHNVSIAESATVLDLKTMLSGEAYENIPVDRQRLIYSGRVMKNDDALTSYKIKAGNTIHLVKSAASNPAPPPASSSSTPTPQAVPTNMAAGTSANNLLAGLTGARFAGHVPLPNQDMFGPDGGMNLPSEDQMADMLSNPAIAQTMNEALNNPAFIDLMIQQNPMLRDMPNAREMLQSPMFRHMLTNPDALRMASRMRRMMGGDQTAAFPAPGATDNTPAGAPASGAQGGNAAPGAQSQNPFNFPPGLFGAAPGGAGAGTGAQAANPFMAMFNPMAFQPPAGNAPAATGTPPAAGSTPRENTSSPPAGGQQQTGANPAAAIPWATLLGATGQAGQAGQGGVPQMTPELQQAIQAIMMGGAPGMGSPPAPPDNRPPEERYAEQLRQLNDMGFYDFDQNVAALRRSGGSVQGAIQHLLGD